MTTFKKILGLVLTLAILLSTLTVFATAEPAESNETVELMVNETESTDDVAENEEDKTNEEALASEGTVEGEVIEEGIENVSVDDETMQLEANPDAIVPENNISENIDEPESESNGEGILQDGVSSEIVEASLEMPMMLMAACPHNNVYTSELKKNESYKSLSKDFHQYSYTITERMLFCSDCGECVQTEIVNKDVIEKEKHAWDNYGSDAPNKLYCIDCGETITVDYPCEHKRLVGSESGNFYCDICFKTVVMNKEQTYCPHDNFTVWEDGCEHISYDKYSDKQHVKNTFIPFYEDDERFAVCNDCGYWLAVLNGKIVSTGVTDFGFPDYAEKGELENHTFENGVCKYCGEEQSETECDHSNKNYRHEIDDTVAPKYLDITETTHRAQRTLKRYCADCGTYLGNVLDEGLEPIEHAFVNGVCECGYVQQTACDHSQKNYRYEVDESVAPKYVNITETTHCVQRTLKRYCADCNTYLGTVLEEGIDPVPHALVDGACVCGYKESVNNPYIVGFTMSADKIKEGETVIFTLNFANVANGEKLTVEFCADSWKETFDLIAPANTFSRAINTAGNRLIKFRVCGENGEWSDYCVPQTLIVESTKAQILNTSIGIALNKSYVERSDGVSFTVTVVANSEAKFAELYVGDHGDTIDDYYVTATPSYTDELGENVFTFQFMKGGNGKSYAGDYKIVVNVLKAQYQSVEDSKTLGTLKITHDMNETRTDNGGYYKMNANQHCYTTRTKVTQICKVCGKVVEKTEEKEGVWQDHSMQDDECSKCGYVFWTEEQYKQEEKRLEELAESVYTDLCNGDNAINKPYPNGFGKAVGYKCGVLAGLQARKLGFDYLNCYGKLFDGQPNGRDWCNYSRDVTHDWTSSKNGLGKDMEITNTLDGKSYIQRIYLEKDAEVTINEKKSCFYDLLAANNYHNIYNVIISYSQKTTKTSDDGHVRYIYAILKDPSTDEWWVYFMDNMSGKYGNEGELEKAPLNDFIKWSESHYYINGVVHFEPQTT